MTPRTPFAAYDRRALRPTRRAHRARRLPPRPDQAVYADTVLRTGSPTGAVHGISLRSAAVRDSLAPQGFVYHVIERAGHGDDVPEGRPTRRCTPRRGRRRPEHTDGGDPIGRRGRHGRHGHGHGARLLQRRPRRRTRPRPPGDRPRPAGAPLPPFAAEASSSKRSLVDVSAASNRSRSHPATTCRRTVPPRPASRAFADCRDSTLAKWVDGNVAFPSSMVDRMVPATTSDDR